MVTVKFNSLLRKAAGVPGYESSAATVKDLLKEVKGKYGPGVNRYLGSSIITVNGRSIAELKGSRTKLSDGDEVSLFPPAAGG